MHERRSTIVSPDTTPVEGNQPFSELQFSSAVTSGAEANNRVTYRSPHLAQQISYMDNPAFHQPEAWGAIMDAPSVRPTRSRTSSPHALDDELAPLMRHATLNSEETKQLFLQMNFLKCIAVEHLRSLGEVSPSPEQLTAITSLLQKAQEIKDRIVLGNVRLTLVVARSFIDNSIPRDDLMSIGLENLMRCADVFDCSKGFKFGTYAGVALRGVYSRAAGKTKAHAQNFVQVGEEILLEPTKTRPTLELTEVNQAYLHDALSAALAKLPPKDQVVLTHRILKEETLEEVGKRVGITKEGARLAVQRALKRLKKVMTVDPRDNFL